MSAIDDLKTFIVMARAQTGSYVVPDLVAAVLELSDRMDKLFLIIKDEQHRIDELTAPLDINDTSALLGG